MADLSYAAPNSVDAAVALLDEAGGGGRLLAGGTDVLVLLHGEIIEPELIVDIKNIPELREIAADDGGWRVGAVRGEVVR